jgi:hypothetical protein
VCFLAVVDRSVNNFVQLFLTRLSSVPSALELLIASAKGRTRRGELLIVTDSPHSTPSERFATCEVLRGLADIYDAVESHQVVPVKEPKAVFPGGLRSTFRLFTLSVMSLAEIEKAVKDLTPAELTKLAAYIVDQDKLGWDEQLEEDFSPDGKHAEALRRIDAEIDAGKFTPMP